MGKITRYWEVSRIDHFAARCTEASGRVGLSVGLSIVLVSGIKRTRAKWNSQNHVDGRGASHTRIGHRSSCLAGLPVSEDISAFGRESENHRSRASKKVSPLQSMTPVTTVNAIDGYRLEVIFGTCQVGFGG
jgi:hypothetical protein